MKSWSTVELKLYSLVNFLLINFVGHDSIGSFEKHKHQDMFFETKCLQMFRFSTFMFVSRTIILQGVV